jgi:ABC-type taurine transport system ATPase subunit
MGIFDRDEIALFDRREVVAKSDVDVAVVNAPDGNSALARASGRGGSSLLARARSDTMLTAVGLDPSFKRRYPHELSGGQQRRAGLARVLGLRPRIVILDEPTSGLDLSVQATVLRLIRDLRSEFGLTYLFISHDLLSETELLIAYGPVSFASKAGPLSGNHFATLTDGLENLHPLGRKTLLEGGQDIRFEIG